MTEMIVSKMNRARAISWVSLNGGLVCVGAIAFKVGIFSNACTNTDEDIEIKRNHGTDDVDPAPCSSEVLGITRVNRYSVASQMLPLSSATASVQLETLQCAFPFARGLCG
jgi:hypothetical protein